MDADHSIPMRRMTLGAVALVACVTMLAVALPARAQQQQLRAEWGANVTEYRGQIGRRVTVVCPADGRVSDVYGTDTYTDDSSVCTAAVHAGVITLRGGGVVTMVVGAGLPAYEASTRNGITSRSFGQWSGSFSFDTAGTAGRIDWTTRAFGLESSRTPVTLECPAMASARVGRVWGSDVYTSDSSICAAAAHAGVIEASAGGRVSVAGAGAQPSFVAATRNGVSSSAFGAWPNSFHVSAASADAVAAHGQDAVAPTKSSAPGSSTSSVRAITTPIIEVHGTGGRPVVVRAFIAPTLALTGIAGSSPSVRSIVASTITIVGVGKP